MKELPKVYDPKAVESRIYQMWIDGNYFHAQRDPEKKPFTIVIPPPNVTGQLHLGHAFDETLQDVLIRYKRMKGYSALRRQDRGAAEDPGVLLRLGAAALHNGRGLFQGRAGGILLPV